MDYNFSWPKVRIDPRLNLCRRIALVSLLREISGANIPDDAVLFYLINTDCAGLKSTIFDDLYDSTRWGESTATQQPMHNITIPDGIRKMAEGYLFEMIAEELRFCFWNGCDSYQLWGNTNTAPIFPKKIREALDRAQITANAELLDHKATVDALHACICNETIEVGKKNNDAPSFVSRKGYWQSQHFDVLSFKQIGKISQLRDLYHRAVNKMTMSRKLLNKYEWNTLCDLLEVLLVLNYDCGYMEAANAFTVLEYAKMAEVGRERAKKFEELYEVRKLRSLYSTSIDRALDFYSRLSPEAAILVGRNVRASFFSQGCGVESVLPIWHHDAQAIKRYLEFKKQNVSTSVKIFMRYEVAIERRKIDELGRALKSHNHTCRRGYDECEDSPCCCCR